MLVQEVNPYAKNSYVAKAIERIETEGVNDESLLNLCWELKFSQLVYPTHISENTLKEIGGRKYLPLFTSVEEFTKHYSNDYEEGFINFDHILEILDDAAYSLSIIMQKKLPAINFVKEDPLQESIADGFIIDDHFIIDGKLLDEVRDFFDARLYSKRELLEMYESLENRELEDCLDLDQRTIIENIVKSEVLTVYTSDRPLDEYEHEGIILWEDFGEYSEICIEECYGIGYVYIFTSWEGIGDAHANSGMYAHFVSFEHLVNFVINEDLDGIMINPGSDNVYLDRFALFMNMDLIKDSTNPKFKNARKCLFKI